MLNHVISRFPKNGGQYHKAVTMVSANGQRRAVKPEFLRLVAKQALVWRFTIAIEWLDVAAIWDAQCGKGHKESCAHCDLHVHAIVELRRLTVRHSFWRCHTPVGKPKC